MDTLHTYRLTRQERLRGKRSVETLFGSGRSGVAYPFRYIWLTDEAGIPEQLSAPAAAILVAVPKRNHKCANKRNRLKRLTREAYRLNKTPLLDALHEKSSKLHLAMVYTSKEVEDFGVVEAAVKKIIARIAGQL